VLDECAGRQSREASEEISALVGCQWLQGAAGWKPPGREPVIQQCENYGLVAGMQEE
jgi:hypothetical protein